MHPFDRPAVAWQRATLNEEKEKKKSLKLGTEERDGCGAGGLGGERQTGRYVLEEVFHRHAGHSFEKNKTRHGRVSSQSLYYISLKPRSRPNMRPAVCSSCSLSCVLEPAVCHGPVARPRRKTHRAQGHHQRHPEPLRRRARSIWRRPRRCAGCILSSVTDARSAGSLQQTTAFGAVFDAAAR